MHPPENLTQGKVCWRDTAHGFRPQEGSLDNTAPSRSESRVRPEQGPGAVTASTRSLPDLCKSST